MTRRSTRSNPRRVRPLVINPTPLQWTLIAVTGTAALVLGISAVASARGRGSDLPDVVPPGPEGPTGCNPSPYQFDPEKVETEIVSLIDLGERDKAYIAQIVATYFFGEHPTGAEVTFPPTANPLPGVVCVWALVRAMIDAIFIERGLDDEMPSEPDSLEWVLRTSGDPGYPWEEPVLHVANYPTPGMFVDIGNADGSWKPSNGYDSMIKAYLGSGLAMADGDVSLASSGAGQELRKQARQAVMAVGGINDLLYGQTNLNYAGGNDPSRPGGDPNKPKSATYVLNEQGRGLDWRPVHKPNLQRIPQVLAPKRAIRADGSRLIGANRGDQHMLVWLPALDLDALAQPVPRVEFLQWSDGSSTIDPPPQIRGLGIDMSGIDLPGADEPGIGQGGGFVGPLPPDQGGDGGGIGFTPA